MKFVIVMAVNFNTTVFWHVTPYTLVDASSNFILNLCTHLHIYHTTWCQSLDNSNKEMKFPHESGHSGLKHFKQ